MTVENWKDAFRSELGGLLDVVDIKKIRTDKVTSWVEIHLTSERLLTEAEKSRVRAAFSSLLKGASVEVHVSYPALTEQLLSGIDSFKPYITESVCRDYPSCVALLSGAVWHLNPKELTIGFAENASANLMKRRRIGSCIGKILSDEFGVDRAVSFEVCEDEEECAQELAHRRELQEEMMARRLNEISVQATSVSAEAGSKKVFDKVVYGKNITGGNMPMKEITGESGDIQVRGKVLSFEERTTKNGNLIMSFDLTDMTSSISCKLFYRGRGTKADQAAQIDALHDTLKEGSWIRAKGTFQYDKYDRDEVLSITDINRDSAPPPRMDLSSHKRVELHMHTKMSTMDGVAFAKDLIKQAAKWGHPAVAITDHGVLQAFPEAFSAAKDNNIKLIPGCEGYLIDDFVHIIDGDDGRDIRIAAYVVLDVETTGLNPASDKIIEIGAVRIENGKEVAAYSKLIDPEMPIPEKVQQLTHISDGDVHGMPTIESVIEEFHEFCKGAILVAHNASFDMAFFKRAFGAAKLDFSHPKLDTLTLARCLLPDNKSHKLGDLCKHFGILLDKAHRAVHDARATSTLLLKLIGMYLEAHPETKTHEEMNHAFGADRYGKSHHIILLVRSQTGMTNLNRIVSEAHLNYFHKTPRIPRHVIEENREGIIVGSACEAGELFRAMVDGASQEKLEQIASFYDYLEVQPIGNNEFMVREGIAKDDEELREYNRRIVALGDKLGKPVCATCDVHFMNPEDAIFRTIIQAAQGYDDADHQAPLYLRTTDEMLDEFDYLGSAKAMEIVVTNTNKIADMVEPVTIFPKHPTGGETFQPFWPDAENFIRTESFRRATEIYGDPLPEIVKARLDRELSSICGYGFSTLYHTAVKLVKKSLSDGYIVGSRGSVGSSFVAHMTGITEVNALPPHYVCLNCHHYEFDVPKQYACGLDLPDKLCPVCGTKMKKDGFNIPFEVFLGFKGDKVPDIDLNFSGVYQPVAHNYVKELFGVKQVYRAGTISAVADKTAYGYVLKYLEGRGMTMREAEKKRLAKGIEEVKRTSGQHPAGMVVVPEEYEIYQFTAIQNPADDPSKGIITTHYDFNSMHDILVKLDILGHDDPTMLRSLQNLTGIAPQKVPLEDEKVFADIISLFTGTKALGVTPEDIDWPTGTLGVPEFGTPFVKGVLLDVRPTSMEELVRISGLSHGTDVWKGNIQDVVTAGIAEIRTAPCTRDDIMNQLIEWGVAKKMSFDIMEFTRKGKAAKAGGVFKAGMEEAMREANVPDWFIEVCRKIAYMFPKGHAVAYVTMALRIAYFKVYYPTEYYACFLERNIEKFNGAMMVGSLTYLRSYIKELRSAPKDQQDDDSITIMQSIVEMAARGIELLPADIYLSDSERFLLEGEKKIRIPLCSLPKLGGQAAKNFVEIRDQGKFISIEDMKRRGVPNGIIEALNAVNALDILPKTSQVSFLDM